MQLIQLVETTLIIYALTVGCIALTIYIVSVFAKFLRETKKRQLKNSDQDES